MALEPPGHLEHGQVDGACARHHDGGGGVVAAGADGSAARPEAKKVQASHRRGRRGDSVSGSGRCRRIGFARSMLTSRRLSSKTEPSNAASTSRRLLRITTTLSKSMFVLSYMQMNQRNSPCLVRHF